MKLAARMPKRLAAALALAAAAATAAFFVSRGDRAPTASAAARSAALVVPAVGATVTTDGELEEAAWLHDAARTGAFVNARGAPAIPFSEARLMWSGDRLRFALYAADIDIRTAAEDPKADRFEISFQRGGRLYRLEVAATGEHHGSVCRSGTWECARDWAPWDPELRIGKDVDGTPDDDHDDDEEWVIEAEIPLRAIDVPARPGERFGVRIVRCDAPRGAPRSCGQWPGERGGDVVLGGP